MLERRMLLLLAVFFTSGATGLIYQVVWSRLLTLVVGVSIFAITAVICTFMAGLAAGSYAIGRWGSRWRDPVQAYGVIEGLIGIYAALTPLIFAAAQPIYSAAFGVLEGAALNAFRIGLSAVILLVPTTLMGGTLPLLARVVPERGGLAKGVGLLYAFNTFGAVTGCLLAGFVLLGELGIRQSLMITAVVNLAIAVVVIGVQRSRLRYPIPAAPQVADTGDDSGRDRLILTIFLLSGFAALGYEVLWTRALLVYLKASTYAFSLMLAVYLLGVASGSMAVSGLAARARRPMRGLAVCQIGVAATAVLGLLAFPHLQAIGLAMIGSARIDSFGRGVALMLSQAAVVLLLPTLFMGAMFPFGVAAYHRASRGASRSVGSLYAVNTAGNIAGSICIGFLAIPFLGVRHSLVALIALNLVVALILVGASVRSRFAQAGWAAAALASLLAVQLSIPNEVFYQTLAKRPGAEILFYREGASDTVAVVEFKGQRTLLYSDGRGAAGTSTLPWNLYFGHLPMLLHDDPQEVLHICYGSGNSVLALTRHEPERVDVVELSPHVRDASSFFWTNEDVIENPIVNLIIEDGRNFLLGTSNRYDVISLEPPNIYTAGVVNLYTQEFYETARDHLKPGGIMTQWLPTIQLSESDRGHLIRAFTEAFPHVSVWQQLQTTSLLLLGSTEPLQVDIPELERRLRSKAIAKDAWTMKATSAADLLSFFLLDDASTREVASSWEPSRDDRTIVDYSIPRFVGSGYGFSLYTYVIGAEAGSWQQIATERLAEYASWGDSSASIVPDAGAAARIDEAIRARQDAGRKLAAKSAP